METKKFVAFSCTHCPLQDEEAIEWLLKSISKFKPDIVVHLGDGHEASSAAKWDNEYDWPLSLEFKSHNNMLTRIRKAAPQNARRFFLPGNHDSNILSINRIDKKLRDLCDYREHEPELMENWEQPKRYIYNRKDGALRIGQVTFAHGYEANSSADEMHSILLGIPYGLYVGGHSHRINPVEQAHRTKNVPLPYWFANAGCMRNLNPEWMERRRTHEWGQGLVMGDLAILKSPRESVCWNAETKVFRMRDDI